MSYQCPRESRALHSDYYRATKKSAFPLNEACMRALTTLDLVSMHALRDASTSLQRMQQRSVAYVDEIRDMQEIPNSQGFLATSICAAIDRCDCTQQRRRSTILTRRNRRRERVNQPVKKIFAIALENALRAVGIRREIEQIGHKVIRFARHPTRSILVRREDAVARRHSRRRIRVAARTSARAIAAISDRLRGRACA